MSLRGAGWLEEQANDQGWTSFNTRPRALGDANGDGRADIVGFAPDGTYVAAFDRQTRFMYDGAGSRVVRIQADTGSITRTVYAGDWYEYATDGATSETTKYYSLGDRRVALRDGQGVSYLHPDHLGSTMVLSGAESSSQRYLPYGGQRGTAEVVTDRRYTGQRWHEQCGLYDYNARWYDPELRRFVQPDTVVPEANNPRSLNRYAYGLNNPVRYTDPTGRFTESELQDFGFSAELIDQWRMDHRWWSVIVNAQLGDLVEAARRYTGPAGSIGGQFASIADEWRDSYENPALYLSGYGEVESFRQQGAGYELRRYEEGEYRSIDLTAMYAPTVAYVREWYGFDAWRVDWGNVALDAASLATFGAARFAGDAAVALRAEQAGLVLGGVQAGQAGAYMLAGSRSTQDKLQLGLALAGTYPHPIWQGVAGAASLAIDLAPGFVLRQEVVWQ